MNDFNQNDQNNKPLSRYGFVLEKYAREAWTRILSVINRIRNNEKFNGYLKKAFTGALITAGILLVFVFFIWFVPLLQGIPSGGKLPVTDSSGLNKETSYKRTIAQLNNDIRRLSRKYDSYTSGQSYLVINTTDNLFHLYRNKKQIREGFCSSGSYKMLQTEEGRSWIFKTPKGKFTIKDKRVNPVWTRPDWAFVEEGLPIPPGNHPSRYEYGVLGDYALSLGDGYLIHGTLYKRFIGMPVTHGCVRLGDEDLEVIFRTLSVGSKVYIF